MSDEHHVARQRRFYDERAHDHLQARPGDLYARNLAGRMVDHLGIQPGDRVLELGAGFGRFTLPLLERDCSVVAVDLSPVALERLDRAREAVGIPPDRCTTRVADLDALSEEMPGERFGWIVGFFLLHHLADYPRSIARLAKLLAPGGRMAFLEPNRRNPLFLLQVIACADMTWAEEKQMFTLAQKDVEAAYRDAGLSPDDTHHFGFFPPQVFNRSPLARRLEQRIEGVPFARPLLPFLLLSARSEGRP